MLKTLEKEITHLMQSKEKIQEALKDLPEGKLKLSSSHGTYQYYEGGKYISKKNKSLLQGLAYREFYEKLLPYIEDRINACEKLIDICQKKNVETLYDCLPMGKQILLSDNAITMKQKIAAFEALEINDNHLPYEITTEIYTAKGEHVRSKSEKIIADELYRYSIPYRYEMPYVLKDRGKKIVIHPDFTVMNKRTGKFYIVEHLGLLDNIEYTNKAIMKLDLLEKNGYLLGRDLLLLHETNENPLNIKVLEEYIDEYFI